jgi:hypothetical protein
MKKIALIFAALILTLSACGPDKDATVSQDPSYPNPSYPNPSDLPANDFAPQSSDAGLVRGNVYLDSTDLLIMESYPLQFMLALNGSLPTPCDQLRAAVSPPDADNRINVEVYSVSKPDEICIQILQGFDANIPLGSFPEGSYTLWVNGVQVAEFDA